MYACLDLDEVDVAQAGRGTVGLHGVVDLEIIDSRAGAVGIAAGPVFRAEVIRIAPVVGFVDPTGTLLPIGICSEASAAERVTVRSDPGRV